jgi:hypothetical protein
MTDNPKYGLRLTERFFFYDPEHGAHVSRQWLKGAVVTDPDAIAFLEQHGAEVERIPLNTEGATR